MKNFVHKYCISRAFDRVPHGILPQKLVVRSLLNWSLWSLSESGYRWPVLASTLPGLMLHLEFPKDVAWNQSFFLIVISDLPDVVCSGNAINLYADDFKTLGVINNSQHHSLFHKEQNNLWSWSRWCNLKLNRMDFNVNKLKVIRISRKAKQIETDVVRRSPVSAVQKLCSSFPF